MLYRVKQLWWLFASKPLTDAEVAEVKAVLSEAEMKLFQLFAANEQQHGLRVLRLVNSAESTPPELQKAALLHDIGKTRLSISWLDRCMAVLLSKLMPNRYEAWGLSAETPTGWKKAPVMRLRHPQWGAEMVHEIGSPKLTVNLIYRHQDKQIISKKPAEDELLRTLQWADDQS